jgi:hypothetical protein
MYSEVIACVVISSFFVAVICLLLSYTTWISRATRY